MSDIKKIRVGGVDYNISPDLTSYAKKSDLTSYVAKTELTSYAKKTDLTGYAKKTEINSLISEVQTKEYYYNDGSNEVVPIKHPDLSTQPSILPYKFMGQYVYEQLIPVTNLRYGCYLDHNALGRGLTNLMFLEATAIYQIPRDATGEAQMHHFTNIKCCCPAIWEYDAGGLSLRVSTNTYVTEESIIYYKIVYTTMPEENIGYYYGGDSGLLLEDLSTSGSSNGYEYVDLGLPSGLKWAKCNIGASTAIDNGLYFAWGETVGYKDASSGKSFSWSDYKYCNGNYETLTKYNTSSSYGTVDNKTTLEPSDDAATVNMGGSWHMPSKEQYNELLNNTTNTWTTINGVNGILFTGNNGNTLFLPASGGCDWGSVGNVGSSGCCWSSSLDEDYPSGAWYLSFYSGNVYVGDYDRYGGHAVRGVVG